MLKEAGDVPLALAAQAPLTDTFGRLLAHLSLHVSHFHQVLNFAIERGDLTTASCAFYDRDLTATTLPPFGNIAEVMDAAAKITTGESARAASETAKLNTDTQKGELAALYPEAQALAVSLINTIEYLLGERPDLDAPGRRSIARAWGIVYINDDGTVEDETTPTPAP